MLYDPNETAHVLLKDIYLDESHVSLVSFVSSKHITDCEYSSMVMDK
jgi:hypothetical protein